MCVEKPYRVRSGWARSQLKATLSWSLEHSPEQEKHNNPFICDLNFLGAPTPAPTGFAARRKTRLPEAPRPASSQGGLRGGFMKKMPRPPLLRYDAAANRLWRGSHRRQRGLALIHRTLGWHPTRLSRRRRKRWGCGWAHRRPKQGGARNSAEEVEGPERELGLAGARGPPRAEARPEAAGTATPDYSLYLSVN